MTRYVILVPRRDDGGHRDDLWAYCRARWEAILPDVPIYEGHHDEGLFNRSAAINRAAVLADADGRWDVALVIDSDIMLRRSQARKVLETARRSGKVTWAHTRWREIAEDWTRRIIRSSHPRDFGPEFAGVDMDVLVRQTNPISWSCAIAIPRQAWDFVGGFDERFVGWGFEDHAFRAVVCGMLGWKRLPGDVYHLWHERTTDGRGRGSRHGGTSGTYTAEAITNALLGRRYMVAILREHGIGDQIGHEHLTEAEAEVHISNLKRDNEQYEMLARRLGIPDMNGWWPSLEELRAGAVRARTEAEAPKVTLVVHTGGPTVLTWPQRREYLIEAVRSLNARVSGPITQRVIYDCWGDPAIRGWLSEAFAPLGFYVVGPDEPTDYTGSMQHLWRYLNKRAVGQYVFMAEDDFVYERDVDLLPMIEALEADRHLAQIALLRDAYYPREQEQGGILGWPTASFTARGGRLEHRLFWTCNPTLFRRTITAVPWPSDREARRILGRTAEQEPSSEVAFGRLLLRDRRTRFAFWGNGEAWIRHIGAVRAGSGY